MLYHSSSSADNFPDPALTITVTRKSQLMDSHVPMQIIINGRQAGMLKNGETGTYYIGGGEARLQACLAMNKTLPYRIQSSDASNQSFEVQSTMTNSLFIIGTILVIISAALVLYTEQLIYMLIAAPPALYHLYLRFIQKDKYLVIKESGRHSGYQKSPFDVPVSKRGR